MADSTDHENQRYHFRRKLPDGKFEYEYQHGDERGSEILHNFVDPKDSITADESESKKVLLRRADSLEASDLEMVDAKSVESHSTKTSTAPPREEAMRKPIVRNPKDTTNVFSPLGSHAQEMAETVVARSTSDEGPAAWIAAGSTIAFGLVSIGLTAGICLRDQSKKSAPAPAPSTVPSGTDVELQDIRSQTGRGSSGSGAPSHQHVLQRPLPAVHPGQLRQTIDDHLTAIEQRELLRLLRQLENLPPVPTCPPHADLDDLLRSIPPPPSTPPI